MTEKEELEKELAKLKKEHEEREEIKRLRAEIQKEKDKHNVLKKTFDDLGNMFGGK